MNDGDANLIEIGNRLIRVDRESTAPIRSHHHLAENGSLASVCYPNVIPEIIGSRRAACDDDERFLLWSGEQCAPTLVVRSRIGAVFDAYEFRHRSPGSHVGSDE